MSEENEKVKTVLCVDDNFGYAGFWDRIKTLFRYSSTNPEKGKTYTVESETDKDYWLFGFDDYIYGKEHFIIISEK